MFAESEAVLIGGQAVNVWAERYMERASELAREGPFTSKDVDAQGDRALVDVCGRVLNGATYYPPLDDATNAGYVAVDLGGRTVGINILVSPYGVPAAQVAETAIPVDVAELELRVIHPVLLMQGKIANVSGLRHDPKELRQARASILCAREYVADLIEEGQVDDAMALIKKIFRFARTGLHVKRAYQMFGLEPFDAITPHPSLPAAFREKNYPQMQEDIAARRAKWRRAYDERQGAGK